MFGAVGIDIPGAGFRALNHFTGHAISYFVDQRKITPMPSVKLPTPHGTEATLVASASEHERIAKLAKALAHPARVQIVATLLRRTTCIGCDLVEEIGLAASTTSEHLRILKEAGLIVGEIAHPRICYSLDPRAAAPLATFLQAIEAGHPPALPE